MDRVLWPEIIMAIFSLKPAASILRTAARLKSWTSAAGTPARTRAEFQAVFVSDTEAPLYAMIVSQPGGRAV